MNRRSDISRNEARMENDSETCVSVTRHLLPRTSSPSDGSHHEPLLLRSMDCVNDKLNPPSQSIDHHRRYLLRPNRKDTSTKPSKVTYPSLNISITIQQNGWAATQQRNSRRRSQWKSRSVFMLSVLDPRRNRRVISYLLSIGLLLLMTISSFSSIFMLLKNQQQLHFHHQTITTEQQQQLHRRRQLQMTANATAAVTKGGEVSSAHYLCFGLSSITMDNTGGYTAAAAKQSENVIPYPFLLDTNVHTVTIPTIDYVAACTQSLVDGRHDSVVVTPSESLSVTTKSTEIPDVITIEYTVENKHTESYVVLIQRLRRRYPNAIIVLVQLLIDPSKYLHLVQAEVSGKGTTNTLTQHESLKEPKVLMNFQQWKENLSYDSMNDMMQSMHEATKDGVEQNHKQGRRHWTMVKPQSAIQSESSLLFESDARILHYANTVWDRNVFAPSHDSTATLTDQMTSFWKDFNFLDDTSITLSSYGHERISRAVLSLVDSHVNNQLRREKKVDVGQESLQLRGNVRNSISSDQQSDRKDIVGDWGSGDDCHLWYMDGDYRSLDAVGGRPVIVPLTTDDDEGITGKRTTSKKIRKFARLILNAVLPSSSLPHKHALEFSRSTPSSYFDNTIPKNNNVVVYNPFATARLLSLSYLADSDGMSYPKTLIAVNGVPSVQIHPIHDLPVDDTVVDIDDDRHQQQQMQHIVKTSCVGYIPPGKSMLRFTPLQDTALPFRLVGFSILALEQQQAIEYAFEIDMPSVPTTEKILK